MPAVKNNAVLGRFATASLTGGDISARFQIWGMAFQGFKERPILGWGQDNFNFVFNKYYNPGMYAQEQWFDRSHDVFLDWLIAGGILGLLSYLLIFAAAVYYVWKKEHHAFFERFVPFLRKSQNQLSVVEKSLVTGLLAGYFFQNLFVFDNIVSYVLFFSVLAFVASMSKPITEIEYAEPKSVLANTAAVLIIILVCVGVYEFAWKPFIAAHDLVYAIEIQPTGDASTNMTYFQDALNQNTVGKIEIIEQLLNFTSGLVGSSAVTQDAKNTFANYAATQMQDQLAETPNDARELLFFGGFLAGIGYPDKALVYLQEAHAASPEKQTISIELASDYIALKQYDNAYNLLKTTYESETADTQAEEFYAVTAVYDNHPEVVKQLYGTATPEDSQIARAYIDSGSYANGKAIITQEIKDNPNDASNYVLLAGMYLKQGDTKDALIYLNKAIQVDPTYTSQVQPIIDQIEGKTATN